MLQRSSDEGDERMSAVIAEIEKEEVNEIERCFERLNSLRELALAFESDEIFNKKVICIKKCWMTPYKHESDLICGGIK